MHSRFRILALLIVIALAVGGWSAFDMVEQGQAPGHPQGPEEPLERVAEQAPGFGGMFLDGDVLKVHMTDAGQHGAAASAIAAVFGAEAIPAGGIQIVPGRYNFRELKAWQSQADALLAVDGVVFTDTDEMSNRVTIGIERAELRGRVEAELRRMGVPADASEVVVTEPVVQLLTLQDSVRPLQGGLQINFPGFLCTYGFNATRGGTAGFVTNSHCTTAQGGVENTRYWQPTSTLAPTSIGTEMADPEYTACDGIPGKVCRRSDSAFVSLSDSNFVLGRIARTTRTGSITIAGNYPIVSEGSAGVGQTVNKVGRTTGWSQGRVTNTCVNTGVSGTNIVQLCQTFVKAKVGAGDSGSPAFTLSGTEATLVGILWGGGSGTFVYSPIANIEAELGSLTTN